MNCRVILIWIGLSTVALSLGVGPASRPTSMPDLPELTSRQQNLLLQLSDAEANIQAINKALGRTGYKVGQAYDSIDSNLKGNELMDRKGGGPVRWDAFYGKTAKDYKRLNEPWSTWGDRRPQQFNFIYKANNDQISRARDQLVALAQDQAALLTRRQKHETDQSRLWATLAWEQIKDREIDLHPLCRFELKPHGPEAAVLQPIIEFLRTANRVAVGGLDSIGNGQGSTLHSGSERMRAAFAALQHVLADALDAANLDPERKKQGEALKAICKQVTDECKVIDDNFTNALDRDNAKQDNSKLEFREQLQASLANFAVAVGLLDDEVAATAKTWNIEADRSAPTPAVEPAAPLAPVALPVASEVKELSPGTGALRELTLNLKRDTNMKFVLISAGRFVMGSPDSEAGHEKNQPQHEVTLTRAFYMGVFDVTQEQYEAVVGKNPSTFRGAKNPVDSVSWDDAAEFCKKLSEMTGKSVRLPTEAEWEYACRAGTKTAYNTGDSEDALKEAGWYKGNSGNGTHPVGQKKPNAAGLYDMHGNVWQWCSDYWSADYEAAKVADPTGPSHSAERVFRGGSWNNSAQNCSAASRNRGKPHRRDSGFGFRVVLDVQPSLSGK